MQTRDQKYAADVYEKVFKVKREEGKEYYNSYGSMAHKLPVLIRTAGLVQALTFVESRGKNKKAYKQLLADLAGTIGRADTLMNRARNAELSEYIRLTQQVMDALLWYKRFAQSVLGVEVSDTIEEEGRANE